MYNSSAAEFQKSVSWYLGYRTFLEQNRDILKYLPRILANLELTREITMWSKPNCFEDAFLLFSFLSCVADIFYCQAQPQPQLQLSWAKIALLSV